MADKRLILLLGGARSGKSTCAEEMAARLSGRVTYVATAGIGDEEMRLRVEAHRARRPASWRTLEARRHIGTALSEAGSVVDVVLLDCLTLLMSNVLMDTWFPEMDKTGDLAAPAGEMERELDLLLAWFENFSGTLIIVSNEVGLGLVPPYPMGRAYRDLLGYANRRLAAVADSVYFLIAGLPVDIKKMSVDHF